MAPVGGKQKEVAGGGSVVWWWGVNPVWRSWGKCRMQVPNARVKIG